MTFCVKNIGKIAKACLSLDGITVVVGPNGSGKSTISRALMTWFATLRRMPDVLVDERIKSAREAVDTVLKANGISPIGFSFGETQTEQMKLLKPEVWLNVEEVSRFLGDLPEYFFDGQEAKKDAQRIVALKGDIVSALEDVSSRDSAFYIPAIIESFFATALDKEYMPRGFGNEDGEVSVALDGGESAYVRFNEGKTGDCKIVPSELVPLTFYFEPIHLLDFYAQNLQSNGRRFRLSAASRYNALDADWRNFLYNDVETASWSVERKKRQAEIDATLDGLLSVMRGHLKQQDRELRFMDRDAKQSISVMNIASGVKTMSVIEKGIRAGVIQPTSMLIIDEPESNLHPQWQVAFAQFLVKLNSKFGIRLLLNTHSPFFLKAIEVFSREEGKSATTHYYHMEREQNGKCFVSKELAQGTNEIFKAYFDVMNDLMSR